MGQKTKYPPKGKGGRMIWRAERIELEGSRSKTFSRRKKLAGILFRLASVLVTVFLVGWLGSWLWYPRALPAEVVVSNATPFSTPTPFPSLPPTAIPAPISREPASQVIDGLQTYGRDQPLTSEQLDDLVGFLNSASPEAGLDEDTYYVTFLASEAAYRAFPQNYAESLPSYLMRHVGWMDRALRSADPPVEGGLIARRLIVVADGIWDSDWDVRGMDYTAHGLLDSDGSWSFIESYCPDKCGFYDQERGLDFGLTHEWIHAVFHLPDHYGLDFHSKYDRNGILSMVPEPWRFYFAGDRPDLSSRDFTVSGLWNNTVRRYSALQLERRQRLGITHDKFRAREELGGFLAEVPDQVVWDLGPELAGAEIRVYRTQLCNQEDRERCGGYCKVLGSVPVRSGFLDHEGRISIGNLFAGYGMVVPDAEGVLFVEVITVEGTRFRWLDIRDFNLAIWEGFGETVVMRFNLASADDDPALFVWEVEYEEMVVSEPSLLK